MEKIKKALPFLVVLFSALVYVGFANTFKRTQHVELFVGFSFLFVAYLLLNLYFNKTKFHFYLLFGAGLLFRLTFLFSTPHLSDDYFRFTWDGELSKDGISAFSFQPRFVTEGLKHRPELMAKYDALLKAKTEEFPNGMNSKQYYSIYPTFNQAVFWLSSSLGSSNSGNLLVMRVLLILAEMVTFFTLRALLIDRNSSRKWSHWYWLNPLIIIELTGNLHFDGFAITFLLLALYFLNKKLWFPSLVSLGLSIVTKLNPIFFLGAVFEKLKWKKFMLYALATAVLTVLLLSMVLTPNTFFNFAKSFGLYFAWFEFNTGLYSFFREVMLGLSGINISSTLSLYFPFITVLLFLKITFFSPKIQPAEKIVLLYFVYFAFSPIVHPWYITVLIPFGILIGKMYPILWSFLIFFTYSAYQENNFVQPYTVVFLEYGLLYLFYYLEEKTHRLDGLKRFVFSV